MLTSSSISSTAGEGLETVRRTAGPFALGGRVRGGLAGVFGRMGIATGIERQV